MPSLGQASSAVFSWLFRSPDRLRAADVVFALILIPAVLLLMPDEWIAGTNIDGWAILAIFVGGGAAGMFSAHLVRRKTEPAKDPFYLRSWSALIGGAVALPLCLVFRHSAWTLAAACFVFGLAPILGNHAYRRFGNY